MLRVVSGFSAVNQEKEFIIMMSVSQSIDRGRLSDSRCHLCGTGYQ